MTHELRSFVENYDELKEAFKGTEFADRFEQQNLQLSAKRKQYDLFAAELIGEEPGADEEFGPRCCHPWISYPVALN